MALTYWEPATQTQWTMMISIKVVRLHDPSRTSHMQMKIKYPIKLTNF